MTVLSFISFLHQSISLSHSKELRKLFLSVSNFERVYLNTSISFAKLGGHSFPVQPSVTFEFEKEFDRTVMCVYMHVPEKNLVHSAKVKYQSTGIYI